MLLDTTSRSVRVEFCSRASTKASRRNKETWNANHQNLQNEVSGSKTDQTMGVHDWWLINDTWCITIDELFLSVQSPGFHWISLKSLWCSSNRYFRNMGAPLSLTSLSIGCMLILPMKSCGPPSHHPHQTPSLCPFRPDFVIRQNQVRQSRVLLERLGQGLTAEIWWTSSPAHQLIKL